MDKIKELKAKEVFQTQVGSIERKERGGGREGGKEGAGVEKMNERQYSDTVATFLIL